MIPSEKKRAIKVILVDDHKLFRKGLAELINDFPGYTVTGDYDNGMELQHKFDGNNDADIALLDINMPEMGGHETAIWLKEFYPRVKILALSMNGNERSILRMVKAGARGYILKDADPAELKVALDSIIQKGYFHSELVSTTLLNNFQNHQENSQSQILNEKELTFLELACSELTYKEIADKMNLAPRTIDGYREALFQKLNVKSRVGMVLYAIKNNLAPDFDSIS